MARGFNVAADVITATTDGTDLNILWDEYKASLDIWNKGRDAVSALFTFNTTRPTDALPLDGGTPDFELASEFGLPKSGRADPRTYTVGFPLKWYDQATRFTQLFLRDATTKQVDIQHEAVLEADNRLLFAAVMRALTTKTTMGTRPRNELDVPIYSLYSGEADDTPPEYAAQTFAPGHNHYLVSGGSVIDGQDLDDLIVHVTHHGYGTAPSERVVLMMHPTQAKVVRGFRAGIGSPASPYDFIPAIDAPAYITDENIIGDRPAGDFKGLRVFGSFGDALLVEDYHLPVGYVIAVATSGANSPRNPLAFRQHERKSLQGLTLFPGDRSGNYPLIESYYQRGFGVGVRNRGAAAVLQIKASGSYESPVW